MDYYIYRHIRLDKNEVFYIGLGRDKNRLNCRWNRNRYWNFIVSKTEFRAEIIIDGLSREEAEEKEREFIKLYGRKDLGLGTLCNLTDGGTGGLGLKHTDETKKKMKGKLSPYKGISKWNSLKGNSESKLRQKYGIPYGSIYRIKSQIRKDKES